MKKSFIWIPGIGIILVIIAVLTGVSSEELGLENKYNYYISMIMQIILGAVFMLWINGDTKAI